MENPWEKISSVNPPRKPNRQIPKEVWLALIEVALSSGEYKVIMTVIERSWGYGGDSAEISLKRFENMTHLSRKGICKIIGGLEARRFIVVGRNGTHKSTYLFNKHYDTWLPPTGEPQFTSPSEPQFTSPPEELVNPSTPDKCTPVHQSSEPQYTSASVLATSEIEPVKETIKEISIKKYSIEIYRGLFNTWNSLDVIKHKGLTEKMKTALKGALKTYTAEEISQAMRNFAEILHGEKYYWTHRWTLQEFIARGLEKFMDGQAARDNYLVNKPVGKTARAGRTPSEKELDAQEGRYFSER